MNIHSTMYKQNVPHHTFVLFLVITISTCLIAGEWSTIGTMPEGRATFHALVVGEEIFVVTGSNADGSAPLNSVKAYNPKTQTWTEKAPINTARFVSGGCKLDGKIYIMGGQIGMTDPSLPSMEMYDPQSDTWIMKAPMKTARRCFGAAALGGKIYVVGGIGLSGLTNSVEAYDPSTDTWTDVAPFPFLCWGHSVCSADGKLYVLGGVRDEIAGTVSDSVHEYDPATNTWTAKANMLSARTVFSVCVIGQRIHLFGGSSQGFPHNSLSDDHQIYNPATNKWNVRESMPTPRTYLSTSLIDGKVYAMGGNVTSIPGPSTDVIEVYSFQESIAENSWLVLGKMQSPRGITAACGINGKLYVVGSGKSVEEYNPKLTRWRFVKEMPTARNGSAACAIDSIMYVTGGQTAMGQPGLTTLHRYNPKLNEWFTDAARMPVGQYVLDMCSTGGKLFTGCGFYHPRDLAEYDPVKDEWKKIKDVPSLERTALCGHDGILYAFGGASKGNRVYAYDSQTETWQQKADMPTGRNLARACFFNGLIYVIGGTTDPSWPFDTAKTTNVVEAYNPVQDKWYTDFEPMPSPRFGAGVCVVDSLIYVVGGKYNGNDCKKLEVYNPLNTVTNIESIKIPGKFLLKNYPNPFNPSTTIEYTLPKSSFVTLKVFDLLGRDVRTLVHEQQTAGGHSVMFDAGDLPSGVYFYQLHTGTFDEIRKMTLLR